MYLMNYLARATKSKTLYMQPTVRRAFVAVVDVVEETRVKPIRHAVILKSYVRIRHQNDHVQAFQKL